MDPTTRANLKAAFAGEALASLRYRMFEQQAQDEGLEGIAELFERIGKEERKEHAPEIARLLGLSGSTLDNLRAALAGETIEHRRLYPSFASQASRAGERQAAELFKELGADEHRHADALRRAITELEHVTTGSEGDLAAPL